MQAPGACHPCTCHGTNVALYARAAAHRRQLPSVVRHTCSGCMCSGRTPSSSHPALYCPPTAVSLPALAHAPSYPSATLVPLISDDIAPNACAAACGGLHHLTPNCQHSATRAGCWPGIHSLRVLTARNEKMSLAARQVCHAWPNVAQRASSQTWSTTQYVRACTSRSHCLSRVQDLEGPSNPGETPHRTSGRCAQKPA